MSAPRTTSGGAADTIEDWAQFVSFHPRLYARPQSIDELKSILGTIARGDLPQKRVRILGSLHSCADILVSDAVIDVSELPKEIEFSPDASTVTASANWTLHDFLLQLSAKGKSLPATGGTDAQTLAGLLSTNTAPASAGHSVYETLRWVEYLEMDPKSGQAVARKVSPDDKDKFPAVVCSLGVIGVITRVQFGLVDEPYFETIQKVVRLPDVLKDLAKTSKEYEFWRVDWLPDSDKGLLWAARRIPAGQAKKDGDYKPDQAESFLLGVFKVWDKLSGGGGGPLLDGFMKSVYGVMSLFYNLDETVANGPLRNMLPVDREAPLLVAMAEWSFDPKDLDKVLAVCREYFGAQGWPNIPTEIELTKTDGYWMSPWNWAGLDYIVKLNFMYLTDVGTPTTKKDTIREHLHGLWNAFSSAGIPFKAHWAKLNFMDPEFVKRNYHVDSFRPLVQDVLSNDYIRERLG